VDNAPITVAAATKVLFATFTLSNVGIGETVRRSIGWVLAHSDQEAANEAYAGAFGMIRVSDLAIAAGVASIPGPVTDAQDDGWFVWQAYGGASMATSSAERGRLFNFDSRAMRRIEEGFGIALVYENASATTGQIVETAVSMYSTRH